MSPRLACPDCGATTLHSVEEVTSHYECTITRDDAGEIEVEYTGAYADFGETATYIGVLHCNTCNKDIDDDALVVVPDDEETV